MVENDFRPTFSTDVEVVAIHCYFEGQSAAAHVQWFGLTFAIALDFDSEVFRRLRQPGIVFPLNFVVDRDGTLAYVGESLTDAVDVVRTLAP